MYLYKEKGLWKEFLLLLLEGVKMTVVNGKILYEDGDFFNKKESLFNFCVHCSCEIYAIISTRKTKAL